MLAADVTTSIKALLYDLDGVLIDTNDWHYQALNAALEEHGYTITPEEQVEQYEGLPTAEKLKLLTKHKGLSADLHYSIAEHKNRELLKLFSNAQTADESKVRLLHTMRDHGFIQILCSNTTKSTVELMLRATSLSEYFDYVITRQDITNPKPDPEVYTRALHLAKVHPHQALALEDSAHGIAAAISSGANVMKISSVADVTYSKVMQEIESYR